MRFSLNFSPRFSLQAQRNLYRIWPNNGKNSGRFEKPLKGDSCWNERENLYRRPRLQSESASHSQSRHGKNQNHNNHNCCGNHWSCYFFALQNGTKGKLNGEYITQTAISDNLINFSSNGGFARFARTFGDWELVAGGKYTLKGKTLTLRCSDGRTWEFQYDRATDTLWQIEPNLYFTRYD